MSFLVVLGGKIDGPGSPGGLVIYQGHLFALEGHLWLCVSVRFVSSSLRCSYVETRVRVALGSCKGKPSENHFEL